MCHCEYPWHIWIRVSLRALQYGRDHRHRIRMLHRIMGHTVISIRCTGGRGPSLSHPQCQLPLTGSNDCTRYDEFSNRQDNGNIFACYFISRHKLTQHMAGGGALLSGLGVWWPEYRRTAHTVLYRCAATAEVVSAFQHLMVLSEFVCVAAKQMDIWQSQ